MSKVAALALSVAFPAMFALGAIVEDARMRDHYRHEGYVEATYDASFDGYWLYLGCLSNDCAREKADSDFIVSRAHQRLHTGKWVNVRQALSDTSGSAK